MKEKKIYTLVLVFCLLLNSLITVNASFIYTDQDTGTSFTVPDDWKVKEFSKERNYIDVKFVPTTEDGSSIIYGSVDLYDAISAFEIGYTRENFYEYFSKKDIAEMYDTTEEKISIVEYNGVEYYQGETTRSTQIHGLDITAEMTFFVYINNGYMYTFQIAGTSQSKHFADIERLLNSVEYPVANVEQPSSVYDDYTDTEEIEEEDGYSRASKRLTVAILLVVIFAIIVLIIIYRNKVKEKELQKDIDDIRNNDYSNHKAVNITEQILICKNCGGKIPLDSKFCHLCGTEIIKEE